MQHFTQEALGALTWTYLFSLGPLLVNKHLLFVPTLHPFCLPEENSSNFPLGLQSMRNISFAFLCCFVFALFGQGVKCKYQANI